MRKPLLLAVLLAAALRVVAADALIVKTTGESVIAHDVEQTADKVRFTDADGAAGELAMADVYQVLPRLVRGRDYPPEERRKAITAIRQTEAKFPKLEKQIRPLLDEWRALDQQAKTTTADTKAALEAEVNRLFADYEQGPKDPPAFARLNSDLGMIKYRDVQGVLQPTIDAHLNGLKTQFIDDSTARLEKLAAKPDPLVGDFEAVRNLAGNLTVYHPPDALATRIAALLEQARQACLKAETARARQAFAAAKNITGYLQANGTLFALEQRVAQEPQLKDVRQVRRDVQGALPGFDFTVKGFEDLPVTPADRKIGRAHD
jgi:hypothetical protein